jgi:CcmD family protein
MKKISNTLLALFLAIPAYSQEAEMADKFRADGKIYVLVSILVLILAGLITYLVTIDRKATRLEKRLGENKPK